MRHYLLGLILILPFSSSFAQLISVDLNNHPDGNYTEGLMTSDFGDAQLLNALGDRFKIISDTEAYDGKSLRVTYNAGEIGASNSGGQFFAFLEPRDEYYLDYYIKFDETFDFQLGGKLPGLSGGESNSGGDKPSGDGWSARYMWRQGGEAIVYLYHMDQSATFGDDLYLNRQFVPGQWHRLTQRVKVNTDNNNDGELQVWFDGELVLLRTNIRYRNNNQAPVDHFFFSTFHGGNTPEWEPDVTSYAYYDNMRIGTSKEEIIPDGEGSLLVQLDRPTNEAVFESPATIQLEASAFAIEGEIASVSFYADNTLLGEASNEPYGVSWANTPAGAYNLTAVVTTTGDETATSSPITVFINATDPEKGPNLALNKLVTVTSEQEGNLGNAAVDGSADPEDRWSASGYPQTLTVDLGQTRVVNRAELVPYLDRAYQYNIAASVNGDNFTTIVDRTNNAQGGALIADAFEPADARYIRLTVTGASSYSGTWVSIAEFRLFNSGASNAQVWGDVSGDLSVSALDASYILQHVTGLISLDASLLPFADVSGNGTTSPLDASLILQHVVGLITCFPSEEGCIGG